MKRDEERARFFTELWDASPDPFWVCEPHGDDFRLLSFNPAQKAVLPKAAEGALFRDLVPAGYDSIVPGYRECVRTRRRVQFDQRYPIEGRDRYFRTTLVPILGPSGAVVRIWGTSRDLTDLVEAREMAVEAAIGLEKTVAERTAMLEAAIKELGRANAELSEANLRYQDLALKDPLTGLANRRCFEETGSRELIRAKRYGRPLSLVILDMDDLKRLNDEFGHPQGDQAIVRVAEAMLAACRSTDLAARLGGDEFALILPETSREEAAVMAGRVLDALMADGLIAAAGQRRPISLSAGAVCMVDADSSIHDLYSRADRALYRAKNSGKGKVETE